MSKFWISAWLLSAAAVFNGASSTHSAPAKEARTVVAAGPFSHLSCAQLLNAKEACFGVISTTRDESLKRAMRNMIRDLTTEYIRRCR